mgnify:CR=1 FL=1
MNFNQLIKERYSVRTFKEDVIKDEIIKELLATINYIPTATNSQPTHVYLLKSTDALNKIKKHANIYNAPLVLLVASDINVSWHNPKEEGYTTAEMDGSITTTYLMLKSWELGLGSVWIRYFNSQDVQTEFSLPENIKPICLLAIGYATDDSKPSPRHYVKLPLDELIKYL